MKRIVYCTIQNEDREHTVILYPDNFKSDDMCTDTVVEFYTKCLDMFSVPYDKFIRSSFCFAVTSYRDEGNPQYSKSGYVTFAVVNHLLNLYFQSGLDPKKNKCNFPLRSDRHILTHKDDVVVMTYNCDLNGRKYAKEIVRVPYLRGDKANEHKTDENRIHDVVLSDLISVGCSVSFQVSEEYGWFDYVKDYFNLNKR